MTPDNVMNTNDVDNGFKTITDSLALFKLQISTLQQQLKALEKTVKKEMKKSVKSTKSKKVSDPNKVKAPSGLQSLPRLLANFVPF